jgi:predicted O-methyltransferase YrrM
MKHLWKSLRGLLGAAPSDAQPDAQPDVLPDALPDAAQVAQWIAAIRAANLSYCGPPKLENLAEAALAVRAARVPGAWLEAGVALGGSAILLAKLKPPAAPLALHDVFRMIPPPGANDGSDAHERYAVIRSGSSAGLGGERYYGYEPDLLAKVKANLRRFHVDVDVDVDAAHDGGTVRCVPGLFEDTLHPDGPVALAHLDCDWYDSVRVCIERIAPRLSPGAIVVFDDWTSYSGCRRAVDEWRARDDRLDVVFEQRSIGLRRRG